MYYGHDFLKKISGIKIKAYISFKKWGDHLIIVAKNGISIFPEKFSICYTYLFQVFHSCSTYLYPKLFKSFHIWRRKGWISERDWTEINNSLSTTPNSEAKCMTWTNHLTTLGLSLFMWRRWNGTKWFLTLL